MSNQFLKYAAVGSLLLLASSTFAAQGEAAQSGSKNSKKVTISASGSSGKIVPAAKDAGAGNGGDADGLQFENVANSAVMEIADSISKYPELKAIDLRESLGRTRILISDQPLFAEMAGVQQLSSAINFHDPDTIVVNRPRWHAIQSEEIRKALAIHELLGLAGIEGTGNYVVSQRYLNAQASQAVRKVVSGDCGADIGCLERKWANGNPVVGTDLGYRFEGGWGCSRREGNDLKPGYNPGFLGECGDLRGTDMKKLAVQLGKIREMNDLAVYEGISLQGAMMDGMDLRNLNFRGVNLDSATLKSTDAREIDLENAKLGQTDFTGANLTEARLNRASITYTKFEQARLVGTDLGDTTAYDGEFAGALMDDDTLLPRKFTIADFTTALPQGERATYDPSLNASIEVQFKGVKIVVNRQSVDELNNDQGPITWAAPSEVKNSPMCFRGDSEMALARMAATFQEDGDYCDGTSFTDNEVKFSECGTDGGDTPTYPIVIPRCP